ncbi:hypothetical protein C8R45DRAFT_1018550 [Mycena sanguinolenta]|nr:hypothetical protein C8R45DRAFT_1018550 [Mycena sanguinolenta]
MSTSKTVQYRIASLIHERRILPNAGCARSAKDEIERNPAECLSSGCLKKRLNFEGFVQYPLSKLAMNYSSNFPSGNAHAYALAVGFRPYDGPRRAYKELAAIQLQKALKFANKDICDDTMRRKIAEAIVHHFECGDDLRSDKPLDFGETQKLAYRLKHRRLFELANEACIKRFQATASHLSGKLSNTMCVDARSLQEWKDRCDAKTAADIRLLDELDEQTAFLRARLGWIKATRSDIYV